MATVPQRVRITARASARSANNARMTSIPLPSPSRSSVTAKAGGSLLIAASASATVIAFRAVNPCEESSRVSRSQNEGLSSTTRRDLSRISVRLFPLAELVFCHPIHPSITSGKSALLWKSGEAPRRTIDLPGKTEVPTGPRHSRQYSGSISCGNFRDHYHLKEKPAVQD